MNSYTFDDVLRAESTRKVAVIGSGYVGLDA